MGAKETEELQPKVGKESLGGVTEHGGKGQKALRLTINVSRTVDICLAILVCEGYPVDPQRCT